MDPAAPHSTHGRRRTEAAKIEDTLAFMFETRLVIRPTRFAPETPALQRDYDACWAGLKKMFKG
jgi:homogentisate 1,2-dioxygenase